MKDSEQRAWRDWSRVEDCIAFGIKRWLVAILASFVILQYVTPLSDWLGILGFALVFWLRQIWSHREDARMAKAVTDTSS